MSVILTWKEFLEAIQALAIRKKTGYTIYEKKDHTNGYLSDKEIRQREGHYHGWLLATISEPVILPEIAGKEVDWLHLPVGVEAIHSDKPITLSDEQYKQLFE